MARRASSERPILCAVLDAAGLGSQPGVRAAELFEAGVDWIQLRDRRLQDAPLLELTRALVRARDAVGPATSASLSDAPSARPRVLVNRRVDVALAAGADGVHLGFDALDLADARCLLGEAALIGGSLHSLAEVEAAAGTGLSYAHLAPIWDPISKPPTRPALGPEPLARACRLGLRVLAQGGVDPERAAAAVAAGAAGVAVTGTLAQDGDPVAGAARLRIALDSATRAPRPAG